MDWPTMAAIRARWGGPFCLKDVASVEDARRAVDIGAPATMVSNHGGRQRDGNRSPSDPLTGIVETVGDRIEVNCHGGVRHGTLLLKALSVCPRACSGGRLYLYALAAAGRPGVDRTLTNLRSEIERGRKLMGMKHLADLGRSNLRWR